MGQAKPERRVTVFSDYICPFCYIGDARLNRLRELFDLKVNWAFLEIHPETSPAGEPVETLNYPDRTWRSMMETLQIMATEEQLDLAEHRFTTNSRSALLLAEAAKYHDAGIFYRIHSRLFEAFFVRGENIGDRDLLRRLGRDAGLPSELIDQAWQDETIDTRLQQYALAAAELDVQATPTFFIGRQRLDGAVPYQLLLDAARVPVE